MPNPLRDFTVCLIARVWAAILGAVVALAAFIMHAPAFGQDVGPIDPTPSEAQLRWEADIAAKTAAGDVYFDLPEPDPDLVFELPAGETFISELPRSAIVRRELGERRVLWLGHPDGSTLVADMERDFAIRAMTWRGFEVRVAPGYTGPIIQDVRNAPMDLVLENVKVIGWREFDADGKLIDYYAGGFSVTRFRSDWPWFYDMPRGPPGRLNQKVRVTNLIGDVAQVRGGEGVRLLSYLIEGHHPRLDVEHNAPDALQLRGAVTDLVADGWFFDDDTVCQLVITSEFTGQPHRDIRLLNWWAPTVDETDGLFTQWIVPTEGLTVRNWISDQRWLLRPPGGQRSVVHADVVIDRVDVPNARVVGTVEGFPAHDAWLGAGPAWPSIETLAPPRPNEDDVLVKVDETRLLHWFNAGGSSTRAEVRRIGRNLTTDGWARHVAERIIPVLDAGCRRVGIHNPFGALEGEPMDFDQALEIEDQVPGYPHLYGPALIDAFRPVIRGDFTAGEPVEVILYFGDLDGDPSMLALRDDLPAWWNRATRSVEPFIDAGFSIGLDSSAGIPAGSIEHAFVTWVRARTGRHGARVYIEPWYGREATHWHGLPIIVNDRFYTEQVPRRFDNAPDNGGWPALPEQVGADVIRLVRLRAGESWAQLNRPEPLRRRVLDIQATAGHAVAHDRLFDQTADQE